MNPPFDLPPITLASCDYNRLLFTVMMGQDRTIRCSSSCSRN